MKNEDANFEFVVITPARNEEEYIEETLKSVTSQTVLPKKWVVVSDGSTDRTETLVKKYMEDNPWIELVALPEKRERHFAAKVEAVNIGYQRLKDIEYSMICIMDADISFQPDFLEYLLGRFTDNHQLGLAGTDYVEGKFHSAKDSYMNESHVNGACQMFRRQCWEEIGGYTPIKGGGIDWVAVMTARMKGWKTRSFQKRTFNHLRPIGTAESNKLKSRFDYGKKDYFLGGHPLWELCRAVFSMTKKPYLIGGLSLFAGYLWGWITRIERPISNELMRFHRNEQIFRLKGIIKSMFTK